ncbi:MAG: RNA-processing protein [archaeon]|nr:MAG: RNA-processing protein [archaeon]
MRLTHYEGKELGRIFGKHKENIKEIEKTLNVKIEIVKNHDIKIECKGDDPLEEYLVAKVLEALALGFDVEAALMLKDTDFVLKVVDLKDFAHGSRLNVVIGRIIGKQGKSKRVIQNLSHCALSISGHVLGLIGRAENVEIASEAIGKLIRGAPHSNVFKFLEKSQVKLKEEERLIEDLKEDS